MKCDSYNTDYTTARCMATKEMEPCCCNGDKNKCNFYPTENEKEPTFIDIVNARQRLCKKFQVFVNCAGCPIAAAKERYCECKYSTCSEFIFDYPNTVVTALDNYNKEHPENPTWHQWLNYVYNYYKGASKLTFTEWLDTEITEEEASKFNIPAKEKLKL